MVDILYVSGVLNESHLVYVASYIDKLKARQMYNENTCVYFESNARFLSNKKIDSRIVRHWLGDVIFYNKKKRIVNFRRQTVFHLFIGSVGLKPAFLMRLTNPLSKIKNVIVDEGIGSESDIMAMKSVYSREGKMSGIRALVHALTYIYIKRWFLANEIWKLFEKGKPNLHIVNFIKANRLKNFEVEDKYILLITQPWVKLGVLTEKEYDDYLYELIKAVSSRDIKLIVKPHPAEDFQYYKDHNIQILDSLHPIELCISLKNCVAVIGFSSTSLILLNSIYGVSSFRLKYDKLDSLIKLSKAQEKLFESYTSEKLSIRDICEFVNG